MCFIISVFLKDDLNTSNKENLVPENVSSVTEEPPKKIRIISNIRLDLSEEKEILTPNVESPKIISGCK